eukprot:3504623-Rhodomonas_salina.5
MPTVAGNLPRPPSLCPPAAESRTSAAQPAGKPQFRASPIEQGETTMFVDGDFWAVPFGNASRHRAMTRRMQPCLRGSDETHAAISTPAGQNDSQGTRASSCSSTCSDHHDEKERQGQCHSARESCAMQAAKRRHCAVQVQAPQEKEESQPAKSVSVSPN